MQTSKADQGTFVSTYDVVYSIKWIVAGVTSLWEGVPATLQCLFMLIIIDYVAGLLKAQSKGECCWDKARDGLINKTMMLMLLLACYYVSKAASLPINIGTGLAAAFCFNEFYSILRNCSDSGVHIPDQVMSLMTRIRGVSKSTMKSGSKRTRKVRK